MSNQEILAVVMSFIIFFIMFGLIDGFVNAFDFGETMATKVLVLFLDVNIIGKILMIIFILPFLLCHLIGILISMGILYLVYLGK